jgi:hypothetical protein
MSASSSSDVNLLVFTWVVGIVYSDVWEEHTAAILRVTQFSTRDHHFNNYH